VHCGARGVLSGTVALCELRRTAVGEFQVHSEHAGTGPSVVLLHGLSGSRRWWRYTTPVLARRYRVHIPELVGFGGSRGAGRQPDTAEMAAILGSWLDQVSVGAYRLVGHSIGGQIALHVAAKHRAPERLVLIAATGLPRPLTLRDAAQIVATALPPRRWGAPLFLPTIAADAVRAGPRALVRATQHLLHDDVRPLLHRISCPTLIVWGRLDPFVPLSHGEALARSIEHARLVVLPHAAHNPMADRPAEFNAIVLDFLDG
jgi:pimeloyl-ACP methyl ester carboxylesterase